MERAVQAKLEAETELEVARAAWATVEAKALADVATAQVEAEKADEEEFRVDFFQGYSDLKRRVALVYPEWDLTAFSGVESYFWEVEVPVKEDPAREVGKIGATTIEGVGETRSTNTTTEETVVVVEDDPPT